MSKKTLKIELVAPILLALFPFVWNIGDFRELFWYSDDLALLHEWKTFGFAAWLTYGFGENIVPVFKLFWAAALKLGDGSYFVMIVGLWVLHSLIILNFGLLLSELKFSKLTVFVACSSVGISWTNIHLLTFAYHWTAGLSTLFTLLSMRLLFRSLHSSSFPLSRLGTYLLTLGLSVFSFSRGIVEAFGLALAPLLYRAQPSISLQRRGLYSALTVVPALLAVMMLSSQERLNSTLMPDSTERVVAMFQYGLVYLAYNPFSELLGLAAPKQFAPALTLILLLSKILLIVIGFRAANTLSSSARTFLLTLLLIDLGTAALLASGRSQEGLFTAVTSRYQRVSLLSIAPFLALTFESITGKLFKNRDVLLCLRSSILSLWIAQLLTPWNYYIHHQAKWQGRFGRKLFFEQKILDKGMSPERPWSGIPPVITYEDAKAVVKEFSLH